MLERGSGRADRSRNRHGRHRGRGSREGARCPCRATAQNPIKVYGGEVKSAFIPLLPWRIRYTSWLRLKAQREGNSGGFGLQLCCLCREPVQCSVLIFLRTGMSGSYAVGKISSSRSTRTARGNFDKFKLLGKYNRDLVLILLNPLRRC